MSFLTNNKAALDSFSKMSQTAGGRPDYVQGGGGNTSAKLADGLMAIKASGFRLADIRPDAAYAVLDYDLLRKFYHSSEPTQFDDVEKAGSEQAKAALKAIEGLDSLRPSVEAGFHSILDNFVIHSHSVYANLANCSADYEAIIAGALNGADYTWGIVPYVNPGAGLCFAIRDEVNRVAAASKRPAVIFMLNHGVIAHHDDVDECLAIHQDVNERLAKYFGLDINAYPAAALTEMPDGSFQSATPFLQDQLKSGAYSEDFLVREPMYPDQLVFLGDSFSFGANPADDHCAWDASSGVLAYRMSRQKAMTIEESLTAVTFIVSTLKRASKPLQPMNKQMHDFIVNWESEKYRKALAASK